MSDFVDVVAVRVLDGYVLELTWADGAVTAIDVEPYLWGPVFVPLRDPALFAAVTVDPEAGTVVWPNGADISPEELRLRSRPTDTDPGVDRPVSHAHGIETAMLEVLLSRAGRPQVDADDVTADAHTWVQLRLAVLNAEPPAGIDYIDWLADRFELTVTEHAFELRTRAPEPRGASDPHDDPDRFRS